MHVQDHAEGIVKVMLKGKTGETYNIGGNNEISNIKLVKLCEILSELNKKSRTFKIKNQKLISFVKDRPAHDVRYAIDTKKIENELNWKAKINFKDGLRQQLFGT